jgi:hypothetical protein
MLKFAMPEPGRRVCCAQQNAEKAPLIVMPRTVSSCLLGWGLVDNLLDAGAKIFEYHDGRIAPGSALRRDNFRASCGGSSAPDRADSELFRPESCQQSGSAKIGVCNSSTCLPPAVTLCRHKCERFQFFAPAGTIKNLNHELRPCSQGRQKRGNRKQCVTLV